VYPIISGHVVVGTVHTLCGDVADVERVQVEKDDMMTFVDVIDICNSYI
jgi:hypothetical protein